MDSRVVEKAKQLMSEFKRSGMRELHLRGAGGELYLSGDAESCLLTLQGELPVSLNDPAGEPQQDTAR
jgi:hypothetical protein